MMLDPRLRGKAVAVCGCTEDRHGIVLAKSEKAKRAGVKTGMVNWEAQRCCKDLIIVPPQYDQYLKYSKLTQAIYQRYTDMVEPFGNVTISLFLGIKVLCGVPFFIHKFNIQRRTNNMKEFWTTITPHCVVGQCSVETLGNIFLPTSRQASSNYGIGVDGRVGMYVEEKNRSWCSSSNANDQRAVTIECASDNTEPYAFKDVVYQRLIELCTDICRRNGKTKLLWLGDKAKTLNYTPKSDEMVLTVHRWFANKSCPGNWMYARMGDLASKVTAALGGDVKPADPVKPTPVGIKAGDLVTITGSTYYNGKAIPGWVKKLRWYVVEVSGDRTVINKDESGRYAIMSPVKTSALAVAGTKPSEDYHIHTVVHGDTLWAIAKKYLGNGSRYKEIVSLNGLKSNVIYSGMKLKIPNK
jgi:hypothetical protein